MKNAVWIWIVRVLSLCVFGPIAGALMGSLRAVDGSPYATVLVSESVMGGLFALFGVFFLAMIAGIIATKAVSLREGVLNLGLVLGWGAWGAGEVGEALRSAPESASIVKLAVEGVLVLVLSVWMLVVLSKAAKGNGESDSCVRLDRSVFGGMIQQLPVTLMLIGVGAIASMFMVWLQVQTDLSGQAVWGGFIGAVLAGVLGGLVIQNHNMSVSGASGASRASNQPVVTNRVLEMLTKMIVSAQSGQSNRDRSEVSLVAVMLGVLLAGVIGPLVGLVMPGSGKILQAIAAGDMPGFLVMSSLSWAAGAMIGAPIGYSWVESSVARQQVNSATA